MLSKWTDSENKRCMTLLSKSQAFKDAQKTLKSTRQGVWASTGSSKSHPVGVLDNGEKRSRVSSRESSRPQSAQSFARSLRQHQSSARLSRPQSASTRSISGHSVSQQFQRSDTRKKIYAYDRTFAEPGSDLRESVRLKDRSRTRRFGLVRPSSATIGAHVSTRPPVRPTLGKSHEMRTFMTKISLN